MKNRIVVSLVCLLLTGVVAAAAQCGPAGSNAVVQDELTKFSSYEELRDFVENATSSYAMKGGGWDDLSIARNGAESYAGQSGDAPADFSTTNIQVEGVDEADIVKTDGEYLYIVSGKRVVIVKAYPPEEAAILSEIESEWEPVGIFVNGDRLVVLLQDWSGARVLYGAEDKPAVSFEEQVSQTWARVYDISDRNSPSLEREVSMDGEYVGSRMVGDYVYVVVTHWLWQYGDEIELPRIDFGDGATEIPASRIYHSGIDDYGYAFSTIVAVDTQNDDREPAYETILLGASSSLYVSTDNIYITAPRWGQNGDHSTSIHRVHIDDGTIEYQASGEAPGGLLNQFSMDEYNGVFRVATTTTNWSAQERGSENNIYVLDMALDIVGKLEGLAPGESIYSARFMGDRCYLVTFKKIDPLFVVDLRDPYSPKVLGQLKITGYSDYLHPYDENHVIGIGKEAVAAEEISGAWYQGVKMSLFDVSDVTNPKEIAKYEIGDRGTESPVLRDHKAFLFDRERDLLVMPVLVAEISESKYPYWVPDWQYGDYVWQGAYVFDLTLEHGFQLEGTVTHYDGDTVDQLGYYDSPYSVERSLYIGDVLYTVSEAKVKMNSLEDLGQINEVDLL